MTSDNIRRVNDAADAIQRRFGIHTLRTPQTLLITREIPHISTSFPVLDRALGIGGIPCGRITEFVGRETSGMGTLALNVMASAQQEAKTAVYVDLEATFDPVYATSCGVSAEKMLLVRPHDLYQGLDIAHDLMKGKGVGVLVFDLGMRTPSPAASMLSRLVGVLADSACAFILLASSGGNDHSLSPHTSLRLQAVRDHWLKRRHEVSGYKTRVAILKNKLSPLSRPVTITISLH